MGTFQDEKDSANYLEIDYTFFPDPEMRIFEGKRLLHKRKTNEPNKIIRKVIEDNNDVFVSSKLLNTLHKIDNLFEVNKITIKENNDPT